MNDGEWSQIICFSIMRGCIIIWIYRHIVAQFSHLYTSYTSLQNPNPKPGFESVQTWNPGLEISRMGLESLLHTVDSSCNSVCINLPMSSITHLQCIQNNAVHLVVGSYSRAHITPAFKKKLCCLPLCCCITFKIAILLLSIILFWDCPTFFVM